MCEECLTEATNLGEIIPGFRLIRAVKDGHSLKAGQYGLIEGHSPLFVFPKAPWPEPVDGLTDEQIELLDPAETAEMMRWLGDATEYRKAFLVEPAVGERLVQACIKAGFKPEEDGDMAMWLYHRIGLLLRKEETQMGPNGEPRVYTPEEIRTKLLDYIWHVIQYWRELPGKTLDERLEGLAFSILSTLDGSSAELPMFKVVPSPHPDDRGYHQKRGKNWFPEDEPDLGVLHEHFHSRDPKKLSLGQQGVDKMEG